MLQTKASSDLEQINVKTLSQTLAVEKVLVKTFLYIFIHKISQFYSQNFSILCLNILQCCLLVSRNCGHGG